MNSLGLDTIAGSKLLQLRFGPFGAFQPEQGVMHGDRRARFIRMRDGAAIIRYWDDSRLVAVPPETLSLPPDAGEPAPPRTSRAQRASATTSLTPVSRSSGSVARWSLSRTARRRWTIE
jgi:hypothetical protein